MPEEAATPPDELRTPTPADALVGGTTRPERAASPRPSGPTVIPLDDTPPVPPGGCTTHEERFRLTDRAFDEMGAGRFHIFLFLTVALGFFIEAAEMNVQSLLLPEFEELWHTPEKKLSMIGSFTAVGMMIGTFFFGRLSDVIGRKTVYQLSLFLCMTVGFISSYATDVSSFATMRLFLGIAYGGNVVSSATLLIESTPTAWRGFFSAMTSFAFTFGNMSVVLLAWAIMDTLGWAWVVRIVSLSGLPACVALFYIPGSVRFYIMKKDYRAAHSIVERIAKMNRVPVPDFYTVEALQGNCDGFISDATLVSKKMSCSSFTQLRSVASSLVPLAGVWFLNSFALSIVTFYPLELEKRYPEVADSKYKIAFALGLGGILGSIVVLAMSFKIKRLTELRAGLAILAVCTLLVSHLHGVFSLVCVILVISHVGMSIVFHGLYTYTPEVFPTRVRVTSFSICQLFHRFAPVFSPYAVTSLSAVSFELTGFVYSAIFVAGIGATMLLTRETFGKALVEDGDSDSDTDGPRLGKAGGYTTVELDPIKRTSSEMDSSTSIVLDSSIVEPPSESPSPNGLPRVTSSGKPSYSAVATV